MRLYLKFHMSRKLNMGFPHTPKKITAHPKQPPTKQPPTKQHRTQNNEQPLTQQPNRNLLESEKVARLKPQILRNYEPQGRSFDRASLIIN